MIDLYVVGRMAPEKKKCIPISNDAHLKAKSNQIYTYVSFLVGVVELKQNSRISQNWPSLIAPFWKNSSYI